MAKRSVYIPDRLWAEIQGQVRDLNLGVSEIIQTALRQAFGVSGSAPEAQVASRPRPAVDDDRLASIRHRLQEEARHSYEDGYRAGTEVAARMAWPDLARGARAGWRLPPRPTDPLSSLLEEVLGPTMGEEWRSRLEADPMFLDGMTDALGDIWRDVTG